MFQIGKFIEELRLKNDEEAYWRALEQFVGSNPAPLKSLALARYPDTHIPEKERVQEGLKTLLGDYAETINTLARTVVPIGDAKPWTQVFHEMDVPDHAMHVCTTEEEARSMLDFLEERLNSQGKIFCLWHGGRLESMRKSLVDRGYEKALQSGKLVLLSLDKTRETMIKDGHVGTATREFNELFDRAQEAGYPETSFGSSLGGSLFRDGYYDLTRDWEAFLHRSVYGRNAVRYCPYPILNASIDQDALRMIASVHNWIASGKEAYPLNLASPY